MADIVGWISFGWGLIKEMWLRRKPQEVSTERPEVIVEYEGKISEQQKMKSLVLKNVGPVTAFNTQITPMKNNHGWEARFDFISKLDGNGGTQSIKPKVFKPKGNEMIQHPTSGLREFFETDMERIRDETRAYPLSMTYHDSKGNKWRAKYKIRCRYYSKSVETRFVEIRQIFQIVNC